GGQGFGRREAVHGRGAGMTYADFGCVGEYLRALGGADGDAERRLEAGLVEPGEDAARIDRLHLRPGVPRAADLGVVEPVGGMAKLAAVIEVKGDRTGRRRAREVEAGHPQRVDLGVARLVALRPGPDAGVLDPQAVAMEVDHRA